MFDLPGVVGSGSGGEDQAQAQDTSSGTKPTQTHPIINPDLRERRFGLLKRVIHVPSTTKVRDSHFSNPLPPPPLSPLALKKFPYFIHPPFISLSLWVT